MKPSRLSSAFSRLALVAALGLLIGIAGSPPAFAQSGPAVLSPPAGAPSLSYFGASVASDGVTTVVGAPDSGRGDTGLAYVYVRSGGSWVLQQKLWASDGASGDGFGWAVAVSGSTIVVGAPDKGPEYSGAAYIFVRSGTKWIQRAEFPADIGGTPQAQFGNAVAVSGTTVVIACATLDTAFVYAPSATGWKEQAALVPSGPANVVSFGSSVAISGNTIVGGGAHPSPGGAGLTYVFVRSGTAWHQQAELKASDGSTFDQFGSSVAVVGNLLVAGSPGQGNSRGEAYVFARSNGRWVQQAKLTASTGRAGDKFGAAVGLSANLAVVGAPGRNTNAGLAYEYVLGAGWALHRAVRAPASAVGSIWFGAAVAVSGKTAVIGAPFGDRAFVYTL
jgi:hypothetical protein